MMIEDFAGSETCIEMLRSATERGLTVQVHAGDLPHGNNCTHGDTNALAAFLLGAGDYTYYQCGWDCDSRWPAVPASCLDWLPEFDMPLGAPLGLAHKEPCGLVTRTVLFPL
jgi:hypothetical protein